MQDPFEKAFYDYLAGNDKAKIVVSINKGEADDIRIHIF